METLKSLNHSDTRLMHIYVLPLKSFSGYLEHFELSLRTNA